MKRHGLSEIVRAFKAFSTRGVNDIRKTKGASVWQRNFYEHLVRNEESLKDIRRYVMENPFNWHLDDENPDRTQAK